MVATATALDSSITTWRAADKPVFLAPNGLALDHTVTLRTGSAEFSQADQSDSSFPTARLYDGHRITTAKAASAATTLYILVDAGASLGLTADSWVLEGHNWNGADIQIRCSDTLSSDVLSGTILTMQSSTTLAADRNVGLLDSEYAGRYWEIYVTGSSTTWSAVRFALTRQHQMSFKGNEPGDTGALRSFWTRNQARSGATQTVLHASSLRSPELVFDLNDTLTQTAITNLYSRTNGFSDPFDYIEDPTTAPEVSIYGSHASSNLVQPNVAGVQKTFALALQEMGPKQDP